MRISDWSSDVCSSDLLGVGLVRVRHRADRSHALGAHHAHLAGAEAQQRVAGIAADKLHVGAGGPRDLAAPARLQLHVMDDGADRDGAQRHRVARLDVGALTGDDSVDYRQAPWRQAVALLAVLIPAERAEGPGHWMVLPARNL